METGQATRLRMEAWMTPNDPNMSMDDAVAELVAAGNQIVAVDHENRRIKVADTVLDFQEAGQ